MRGELVILKRDTLFEVVWSRPVRTVAHEYGLSDVALAKICRKMGIPLPGRGYWARQAAGKKVSRPELPKLRKGEVEEHRIHRREPKPPDSAQVSAAESREQDPHNAIVVRDTLQDPHPLVRRSRASLERAAKTFDRANRSHRCLDVMVSPEQLDRGLRIMDALIRAVESRGLVVEVAAAEGYQAEKIGHVTRVRVHDEWVHVGLEESRSQVKLTPPPGKEKDRWFYPRTDLKPNGTLKLLIRNAPWGEGTQSTWADGKTARLETRLNDFVVGLFRAADAIRLAREAAERQQAEWREAARRREEQAKRAAIVDRLADDLHTRSEEWLAARRLLEYLDAVEAHLSRNPADVPTLTATWLSWGRAHADAAALRALSDLLNLRPTRRADHSGWGRPSVSPEEVLQYLQAWGETKPK